MCCREHFCPLLELRILTKTISLATQLKFMQHVRNRMSGNKKSKTSLAGDARCAHQTERVQCSVEHSKQLFTSRLSALSQDDVSCLRKHARSMHARKSWISELSQDVSCWRKHAGSVCALRGEQPKSEPRDCPRPLPNPSTVRVFMSKLSTFAVGVSPKSG